MFDQYHKDVFLPKELELSALTSIARLGGRFRLTRHAEERAEAKQIRLPERIPFESTEVVEVTRKSDGSLFKFLIRFPHDESRDVCMSLSPCGKVPTCWLNDRTDQHSTLRAVRYVSA